MNNLKFMYPSLQRLFSKTGSRGNIFEKSEINLRILFKMYFIQFTFSELYLITKLVPSLTS